MKSGFLTTRGPLKTVQHLIVTSCWTFILPITLTQLQKFKKYISNPEVRELLIIGGVNVRDQTDVLARGVDIVVATPGRLEDLISTGKMALHQCRFFVLDECDGLLSAGYSDLINRLHGQIPKVTNDGKRLQMIVCSATLHSFDVKKMAERLMYFPTWIDLKGQDAVPETVHHCVCMVDPAVDTQWKTLHKHIRTDGVHDQDRIQTETHSPGKSVAPHTDSSSHREPALCAEKDKLARKSKQFFYISQNYEQ
ncbi:ATP-dependent RNA helicase Ddx1 [Elysia marginata]|uniref:ATP-dependent RNA helicase Ddx1 n=1 Tax=Elysia marginata TaxID=1093978 RepID=A0AAV4ILQ4_9GAST|nr:ATP-dependent RNA helicase Ddx1 [Elysia marginata]